MMQLNCLEGENEDDYSEILKEVKEDDTLDKDDEDNEDDLKYEESDEDVDIDDGDGLCLHCVLFCLYSFYFFCCLCF